MNLEDAAAMARDGRLYPSLIIHGGTAEARLEGAERIARTLLCDGPAAARPCGSCRHCRRISVDPASETFHPDFRALWRDLRTVTSVEAAKGLLALTHQTPFEARGQVMVVAEAETLSGEAANTLLKTLEEPPVRAPRHFLLLAPAQQDLLATIRSRSWAVYLGSSTMIDVARAEELGGAFAAAVDRYRRTDSLLHLLEASSVLGGASRWEDPRDAAAWGTAAAAARSAALSAADRELGRRLLDLAADLLDAPRLRLRSIPAHRILDGLVSRHLARASR